MNTQSIPRIRSVKFKNGGGEVRMLHLAPNDTGPGSAGDMLACARSGIDRMGKIDGFVIFTWSDRMSMLQWNMTDASVLPAMSLPDLIRNRMIQEVTERQMPK